MIKLLYIRYSIIVVFMIVLIGCKHDAPTEPKEIPKGVFIQKIVFTNYDSLYSPKIAVGDLYNDSGTFRLYNVNNLVNGESACLSKDQSWIAYISYGNNLTLRRINIDGTNNMEVPNTSGLTVQEVSISPNNSSLAVVVGGYFTGLSLGIIPSTGGEFKEVYHQVWANADWSPDSKRIFFSWPDDQNRFGHNVPPLGKSYIASINVDGTGMIFISDTTNGLSDDIDVNISPDGKRIAFVSERSHPGEILPEIYSMDIDGKNVLRLTEAISSGKKGDHYDYYTLDSGPKWLKDSEHIIFQRDYYQYDYSINHYKRETKDLYIENKDGTGLQNVTNNGISAIYKK